MVEALLALPATLGALVATGLLVKRAYMDRLLYLIAWSLVQVGLSLALVSMTLGFLVGFNGLFFRVMELGAALLAPMWLALGMIELIARYVQVRFAAWLFAISYTAVAVVIVMVDPLRGSFTKSMPDPRDTYDAPPLLVIDGGHVVSVIALVACLVVTALLASRRDQESYELLIPIALIALAGVLVVSGTRGLLPGPLAAIALGGAAGLVWYGAMRTLPIYQDEDEYDDGYDGYDEPATGYEEPAYAVPPPEPRPEPHPELRGGGKRGELRFPEPAPVEEPAPLGYPDKPAAATVLDDVRNALPSGAPGAPPEGGGYGQITVFTLLDGREDAFDRQAEELIAACRAHEPDTLVFTSHEVVDAPTQRIFYQLFRDRGAFEFHRGQAHLRKFHSESRTHVLATNVIDLALGAAKLPAAPAPKERPLR